MENFDFEKRAVPSPYTVPDGFFDQMEERLASRVAEQRPKTTRVLPFRLRYAAAAVVAIAIGSVALMRPPATESDNFDDIARVFQQMSPDDQYSMLESYQDDIFMND